MSWDKIVPSILDQPPVDLFEIKYPTFDVQLGQELKPAQLLAPPSFVNWPNIDPNALYTMVLVDCDPDDADNYEYKQLNLGLAINMPAGYITRGFVISPYYPPRPKEGSGLHRYLVAVFKQPDTLNGIPFAVDDVSRHNFDVRVFANTYNLGQPVAGTYFVGQADESTIEFWANYQTFSYEKSASFHTQCSVM